VARQTSAQAPGRKAAVTFFRIRFLRRTADLPGSEPDVTYAYDNLGRLTSASQTGIALSFTYDALGRQLTETGPQGTATSAYDVAGRRTQLTYPGTGLYVNYDYLVTGEVTQVRENGATSGVGVLATYGYDDLRRRTSVTYGNGASQAYSYDAVSRLASLTNDLGGTASDLTETFAYNPASQIVSETRSNDAYAFHPSNESTTTVTNGLNQLSTVGGASAAYDAKGNMTADPATGRNNYFYTSENLLREPGYGVGYDSLNRLLYAGGAEWVMDGADAIEELAGTATRRYVLDPDGQPVVWYEGTGTTDRRFLSADERGSIISVSDGSAGLIGINAYDEYGRPGASNVGRFGYTGQIWIGEYSLNYHHARFRNPSLSPFMQPDPIGPADDPNVYS
jgi:RHS repeat-associated protein